MKWDRASSSFILLTVLILAFSFPAGSINAAISNFDANDIGPNKMTPSADYSLESLWDGISSSIEINDLSQIIRTLSLSYPSRWWYYRDASPSPTLEEAWDYVNDTLSSYTGGELHFKLMTQAQSLVAIKNGTGSHLAPILVCGIVSSRYSPAANSYGSTVAAVLETAKVLHSLDLANDVYYVLINSLTVGTFTSYGGLHSIELLIEDLNEQDRVPAGVFWYDSLLFNEAGLTNGDKLRLEYPGSFSFYTGLDLIIDMAELSSQISGQDRLVVIHNPETRFYHSGAYEAWLRGIPGFAISQYYYDGFVGTEFDRWDNVDYDYNMAVEAITVISSLVAYGGMFGSGEAPRLDYSTTLNVNQSDSINMPLTGLSYVNVTMTWNANTTIKADIISPSSTMVYSRTESDKSLTLIYLVQERGVHTLEYENVGNETTAVFTSYSHYHDIDSDTLDDYEEYLLGTDSLSTDSDMDFPPDPVELEYGTDPLDQDSDDDLAFDGIEVMYGSDPLVVDSDGDTLADGYEIYQYGTDPTNADSDSDGIEDNDELQLGLNPLSNDTDGDGLLDLQEIDLSTNPISPDSDGDGLSDFFEVINGLNPLSIDSDGDGLTDLYEIQHCLLPFDIDTDADGLLDNVDWAPREHWITIVPNFVFGGLLIAMLGFLVIKRRNYMRSASI
ncbi:MAG: hypothetical protein ACXAB6_04115 [Candidatus Thorarchaeota archaeon]|jgi:hypothetical protein